MVHIIKVAESNVSCMRREADLKVCASQQETTKQAVLCRVGRYLHLHRFPVPSSCLCLVRGVSTETVYSGIDDLPFSVKHLEPVSSSRYPYINVGGRYWNITNPRRGLREEKGSSLPG